MSLSSDELIAAVIDSQVLAVPYIYQAVVATPTVRIDDALWCYLATYNGLQSGFRTIRNNFGVDFAVTFEDTENNCFAISTSATFPFDSTCAEERFIDFNLSRKWRLLLTKFSQTFTMARRNRLTVLRFRPVNSAI